MTAIFRTFTVLVLAALVFVAAGCGGSKNEEQAIKDDLIRLGEAIDAKDVNTACSYLIGFDEACEEGDLTSEEIAELFNSEGSSRDEFREHLENAVVTVDGDTARVVIDDGEGVELEKDGETEPYALIMEKRDGKWAFNWEKTVQQIMDAMQEAFGSGGNN